MLLVMANWKPGQLQRLAEAVIARRTYLGLSQVQVWQAGGPSNSTLTDIEKARATTLEYGTLRKLDVGLSWGRGTALSHLSGKGLTQPAISHANTSAPTPEQVTHALAVLVSAGFAELQRRAQGWPQEFLGLPSGTDEDPSEDLD